MCIRKRVNTQFNGLVTIETPWSFVPRWLPPFISGWVPEDRCHLNGLALAEDGSRPLWVTALAESDRDQGWRDDRIGGGCLVHVPSGDVVLRGLAMPHSPRLYRGVPHRLDSGRGPAPSTPPPLPTNTTMYNLGVSRTTINKSTI